MSYTHTIPLTSSTQTLCVTFGDYRMSNAASMNDMASTSAGALRALAMELKNIESQPLEGFTISASDDNLFVWTVGIYGPPNTLYQGGYFKAVIRFPPNYPYSPPSMKFLTKVWHPNVYENGDLCISILHPPVDDPHSGELPCERWNPTQSVRTILLSVISLLNEPNTSSPANVDASVMYRKWKDGTDMSYADIIRRQVEQSKEEARKDGVTVPETLEEYCIKFHPPSCEDQTMDLLDLDDDMYDYGDDESDDENDYAEEDEDSGQGEN